MIKSASCFCHSRVRQTWACPWSSPLPFFFPYMRKEIFRVVSRIKWDSTDTCGTLYILNTITFPLLPGACVCNFPTTQKDGLLSGLTHLLTQHWLGVMKLKLRETNIKMDNTEWERKKKHNPILRRTVYWPSILWGTRKHFIPENFLAIIWSSGVPAFPMPCV